MCVLVSIVKTKHSLKPWSKRGKSKLGFRLCSTTLPIWNCCVHACKRKTFQEFIVGKKSGKVKERPNILNSLLLVTCRDCRNSWNVSFEFSIPKMATRVAYSPRGDRQIADVESEKERIRNGREMCRPYWLGPFLSYSVPWGNNTWLKAFQAKMSLQIALPCNVFKEISSSFWNHQISHFF